MLRRVFLVAVLVGIAGAALYWWLTIPAVIAASALAPHQPNLANGLAVFNAGGCASCHATPGQDDRTARVAERNEVRHRRL